MKENTDEAHPVDATETRSDDHSAEISPIGEVEPGPQNQNIENMEVHHHPDLHHKPKKWKEYFLEFLMIFLAVTLGFFAESFREHLTERTKEKEYLASLLSELRYDTAQYRTVLQDITYLRPLLDSMYVNVSQPERFNYVLQAKWNTPVNETELLYQPALTTIEQLEHSGNLRLIENKDVVQQAMIYETFVKNSLQSHNQWITIASDNIFSQEDAICNEADFNDKIDNNMLQDIPMKHSGLYDMTLLVKDPIILNKLANSFVNYKARSYGYSITIKKANNIARQLLDLVDKELKK